MRNLTADEERLVAAIRLRLSESKKTHVDDEIIQEATRLIATLTRPRSSIVERVGPVCSTADLVDWMGISRQAINKAVKEARILGVRKGRGSWMYPTWQLDANNQVLEGLPKVLERLKGVTNTLDIGEWFVTKHHDLDGMTPAQWLQEDRDLNTVVGAAENLARHRRQTNNS